MNVFMEYVAYAIKIQIITNKVGANSLPFCSLKDSFGWTISLNGFSLSEWIKLQINRSILIE